jgi:hypothetical protein
MWLRMKIHTTVHRTDRRPQSFLELLKTVVEILVMFMGVL